MKSTNDKYYANHIAFTIANLYRRYCDSTKSRKYACENGKNEVKIFKFKLVNITLDEIY